MTLYLQNHQCSSVTQAEAKMGNGFSSFRLELRNYGLREMSCWKLSSDRVMEHGIAARTPSFPLRTWSLHAVLIANFREDRDVT